MAARPPLRIALNVAIDGALAALAVPLARAVADPSGSWLQPPWLPLAGAAALLVAGLPFRLPWQFWRFAGIDDLLGVAWSSVGGAALLRTALAFRDLRTFNEARRQAVTDDLTDLPNRRLFHRRLEETLRELVRTNDAVLVSAIQALLNAAGIPHVLLDQNMSVLEGSIGILPRRLLVAEDYAAAARRLLEQAGYGPELRPDAP